jgi:hypothetical protein
VDHDTEKRKKSSSKREEEHQNCLCIINETKKKN